jgi:hypothetical protein
MATNLVSSPRDEALARETFASNLPTGANCDLSPRRALSVEVMAPSRCPLHGYPSTPQASGFIRCQRIPEAPTLERHEIGVRSVCHRSKLEPGKSAFTPPRRSLIAGACD